MSSSMRKALTSVTFAILVAVALLIASSAYFATAVGTSHQWVSALANGIAAGGGGTYVGTMARRRRRLRRRRP
ncbi:hypothetical protein EDF19_2844 [Curtobacterium sp. PhB115]|nr:hypothetical protein EDF19_2844 [Curtobacterium sp. PhB115]